MRRDAAKRWFEGLLISATVAACGGAVARVEEEPSGGGSGRDKGVSTSDEEPSYEGYYADADTGEDVRAPRDGGRDAKADVVVNQGDAQTFTCLNGVLEDDGSFCCDDPNGANCRPGGGGGDGPTCKIDCEKVCTRLGITLSGSMNGCYVQPDGKIGYTCGFCGVGRIPTDVPAFAASAFATTGERLAMQAYYEAASVLAFLRLAQVLVRQGAPERLVARAESAAADEAAHAETVAALARARGVVPTFPNVGDRELTLLDVALENAAEGQVRESYGALVVRWQADHAEDADVRAAFASIAEDEADHAAFSWELAGWLETRLGGSELRAVEAERMRAEEELRKSLTASPTPAEVAVGLPPANVARALFDALVSRGRELAA
jgi:hypothetical protein